MNDQPSPQPPPDSSDILAALASLEQRVTRIERQLAGHTAHQQAAPPSLAAAIQEVRQPTAVSAYQLAGHQDAPLVAEVIDATPSPALSPSSVAPSVSKRPSLYTTGTSPKSISPRDDSPLSRWVASWQDYSWEQFIGGPLLTWAGAFVLVLALGFTVHWWRKTFEVPAWVQVTGLHLLGIGFLAAAHLLQSSGRLRLLMQGLAGLGIFTLYAAGYAALHVYQLFSPTLAFAEGVAVTLLAITLAVRARAVGIVLLAALGGYLTPLLTSTGQGSHVALFSYLAFLNVALLGSAVWRGWNFLKPLVVAAMALMFLIWHENGYQASLHLWSTTWMGVLHTAIVWLSVLVPALILGRASTGGDLLAKSGSTLGFLGLAYALFHPQPEQQLALLAWGLAAVELGLFFAAWKRLGFDDRLPRILLGLSAVCCTLAVPLQLDDWSYLGLAWCVEGAIFTLLAVFFTDVQLRVSAVVMLLLGVVRLLGWDYQQAPEFADSWLQNRSLWLVGGGGLLVLAAGTMHWTVPRRRPPSARIEEFSRQVGYALMAVGNLVILIALTCQWTGHALLALWTLDAALAWWGGFAARSPLGRWHGCLLAALPLALLQFHVQDRLPSAFVLLANPRAATVAALAATLLLAAYQYHRLRQPLAKEPHQRADTGMFDLPDDRASRLDPSERILPAVLSVLGHLLMICWLSWELRDWLDQGQVLSANSTSNMARLASYSVLWAVYAALVVAAGFALRLAEFRLVGLAGFAIVLIKVFFVDLATLELFPRVLAFAVLGLMLLATSALYQKFTPARSSPQDKPSETDTAPDPGP